MPLINVEDRLFAYARAANEEPTTINDPFFRDLIANPVNALGRFDPRQVLLVRRGSKDLAHRVQEGIAATIRMGHSIFPVCGVANARRVFFGN